MRWAAAAAAFALLVGACGDDTESPDAAEAGTDAGTQFAAAWAGTSDEPIDDALGCIDEQAPLLGDAELLSLDPTVSDAHAAFLGAVFDECLSDAQVTAYFVADIPRSIAGTTAADAECLAPPITAALRTYGYTGLFVEHGTEVATALDTARLRCGIVGPSRKGEARFFGGLRTGDAELLTGGVCPGAFDVAALTGLAARNAALAEAERATTFLLVSEPTDVPERWTTTVAGIEATLLVTPGTFADGAVCVAAVDAEPAEARQYLVPG